MLTLEEYNKQEAQKALNSGVYNTVYSNCYNSTIDINNCNPSQLNKEDKEKVLKAKENIKRLQEIAEGKILDPLYELYYINVYLRDKK